MSLHAGKDFRPSKAVANRQELRRLAALVWRRQQKSSIAELRNEFLLGLLEIIFRAFGVGIAMGMITVLVLRPLIPVFDEQVAAPAVFGFVGCSAFLVSLICGAPFGESYPFFVRPLANTPAAARLIYLLPLRQTRRSAMARLGWSYFFGCFTALGLVILSPSLSLAFGRIPWGAALLCMLMFLPSSMRRVLRQRNKAILKRAAKQPRWVALAKTWALVFISLFLLMVCLCGDQVAILLHGYWPKLMPVPEQVGHTLGWLPHAGIMAWMGGGPYPWAASFIALACGSHTAQLAWDHLMDRHLDEALDDDPTLCPMGDLVGASTLGQWLASATDEADEPIDGAASQHSVLIGNMDREEVAAKLSALMAAQGEQHPANIFLKRHDAWIPKSSYGMATAIVWAVAFVGLIGLIGWMDGHPKVPKLVVWAVTGLGIIPSMAVVLGGGFAPLAGWAFTFRLPRNWQNVPVDIREHLEVFLAYDWQQYRNRLLWIGKPLLSFGAIVCGLRLIAPNLAVVHALGPRLTLILGILATAMLGLVTIQRVFGSEAHPVGLREHGLALCPLGFLSGVCHFAGVFCFGWGVVKALPVAFLGAAALTALGERLRIAAFRAKTNRALFGRMDG